LPSFDQPASILPPSTWSFEEAGSIVVYNDSTYDLYITVDGGAPSANDLRVPARSVLCWPVRTSSLAISVDHSIHDPAPRAIAVWISESTLPVALAKL